jgi:hypothetical protein
MFGGAIPRSPSGLQGSLGRTAQMFHFYPRWQYDLTSCIPVWEGVFALLQRRWGFSAAETWPSVTLERPQMSAASAS